MTYRRPSPQRTAFTLLEILLVVLVIGIAVGAILPPTLQSIEGARLRAASRDVISINQYARARAILDHRPVAVLYDPDPARLELVQLPAEDLALGPFLDTPAARLADDPFAHAQDFTSLRTRTLHQHITIRDVPRAERVGHTWYAVYYPSGMCDPHSILLQDNRGDTIRLSVNGMTGDITLPHTR